MPSIETNSGRFWASIYTSLDHWGFGASVSLETWDGVELSASVRVGPFCLGLGVYFVLPPDYDEVCAEEECGCGSE
jgi:hypothetical protein